MKNNIQRKKKESRIKINNLQKILFCLLLLCPRTKTNYNTVKTEKHNISDDNRKEDGDE